LGIVIVGSVALDTVETPVGRVDDAAGGAATYSSLAAALLARPVAVVGVVGTDFPDERLSMLREHGVDIEGIERAEGRTFRWVGRYHDDMAGRDTLDTQLNVFAGFRPQIPDSLRAARHLFLANIQPGLQLSVLDQMDRPRLTLLDTMNFWISGALAELRQVMARVDVLLVNDEEARMLTGHRGIHDAGRALLDMGPRFAVVKKGEHGASLYWPEGTFLCPAYPVTDVVDPTGAGDSFAGGLIGSLANESAISPESLRRAMVFGTAVASYCVEGFGVQGLLRATRAGLEERYGRIRELTDIPPL